MQVKCRTIPPFKFRSNCTFNKVGIQILSLNKAIREANLLPFLYYLTLLVGMNSLEFGEVANNHDFVSVKDLTFNYLRLGSFLALTMK